MAPPLRVRPFEWRGEGVLLLLLLSFTIGSVASTSAPPATTGLSGPGPSDSPSPSPSPSHSHGRGGTGPFDSLRFTPVSGPADGDGDAPSAEGEFGEGYRRLLRMRERVFLSSAHTSSHGAGTAPAPDLQQDDPVRDELLKRIIEGLPPAPRGPGGRKLKVGIVGAGIAGLVAAQLLQDAGYKVTIFEAAHDLGGRMQTLKDKFPGGLFANTGAMRFPCSHFATHAYLRKFGITPLRFTSAGPESLIFLTALGHPVPARVLDPSSSSYDPKLLQTLCRAFSIEPCRHPTIRFQEAMQPWINRLREHNTPEEWNLVISLLDHYSLQSFLREQGWSVGEIELWSVLTNQEAYLHVNLVEYFRDYAGGWWNDDGCYPYPESSPPNPLYAGLPRCGLWELPNGTHTLPQAFWPQLKSAIRFGHAISKVAIDKVSGRVTLHWVKNNFLKGSKTFDFTVITAPFSAVRFFEFDPPLSHDKQRAIREVVYIPSTKIMVQYRRRFWEQPSCRVPIAYGHKGMLTGGSLVTDGPLRTVYFPSHAELQDEERGVVIVSYSWSSDALLWVSMPLNDQLQQVVKYMREAFGMRPERLLETAWAQGWSMERWLMGGWAYFQAGQERDLYEAIVRSEPVERPCIFIAGELASHAHSWVHGAIISAVAAVTDLSDMAHGRRFMPVPSAPEQESDLPFSPEALRSAPFPDDDPSNFIYQHFPCVNVTIFCGDADLQIQRMVWLQANCTHVSHHHAERQMGIVEAGSLMVTIGERTQEVTATRLFHVPPGVFHAIASGASQSELAVSREIFTPQTAVCRERTGAGAAPSPSPREELVHGMSEAATSFSPAAGWIAFGVAAVLLVACLLWMRCQRPRPWSWQHSHAQVPLVRLADVDDESTRSDP